jgi:methylated-DNA-[protein]-cysteine S-methyltransferase
MAHARFDTTLGPFGIAWSRKGLTHLSFSPDDGALPGPPEAPPKRVREAISQVHAHLGGAPQRFRELALDLSSRSELEQKVYALARAVPSGQTTTYGELARALGNPGLSRAVGGALGRNPLLLIVPCHRVLAANGKPGGFSAPGGLTTKRALLELEGHLPQPSLFDETGRLAVDEAAVRRTLAEADPELGALMDRVGPLGLARNELRSPYEALVRAIIGQQITGSAARSIFAKLTAAFGGLPPPEKLAQASDETLRGFGVSRNKALSLRDLAVRAEAGEVPPLRTLAKLGDEPIVERLTRVRGIGRWTVQMMLMFHLGRPDVLPVADLGIQKGFGKTFLGGGLGTPAQIQARAARWRPFRTVASWYLWRAAELP